MAQDTWLAVLHGLPRFEGRSSLKTWIFRILVNRAKTRAVRDRRMVNFSVLGEGGSDEPAVEPERFAAGGQWLSPPHWEGDTPEKVLLRGETTDILEQALTELLQAQCLLLRCGTSRDWKPPRSVTPWRSRRLTSGSCCIEGDPGCGVRSRNTSIREGVLVDLPLDDGARY